LSRVAIVSAALLLAAMLATPPARAAPGDGSELNYVLFCQGCHQADGRATPGKIPALAGSVGRFLYVPGGRAYLVRVPGVAQAPLDDAALAGLLDWMLERFAPDELSRGFAPYAAEEVARERARPLVDVERVRRELLDAYARSRFVD
jgi:hypothetical protein